MNIADFARHRFGWTADQVFAKAMDSMRALNARVGASRLILDQHEQGSAIHTQLSSLQSAAICEMIASTVMTADIRSEVGSRAVQVSLRNYEGPEIRDLDRETPTRLRR
jgi:hypothetical protein